MTLVCNSTFFTFIFTFWTADLTGFFFAEDQRSIANRLGREEQRSRKDEQSYDPQAELNKKDPTLPVSG
jgi:hypothetical protein